LLLSRSLPALQMLTAAGVKLALGDKYTASQSDARDLISTVWNILDCNINAAASTINSLEDVQKVVHRSSGERAN
jgi:hypothetical protein